MISSTIAPRTGTVEASASSAVVPSVRCEFHVPACEHATIFHNEYLRTNRTNHTKIMRCFPHCCPGHRERSYCGTPLHVRIHCDSPLVDNRLVVFARFRPAHIKALNIGDCVSLKSIRASLQSADPSTGQWIESCRSPLDTDSVLYEINPNGRWFYPWGGAATLAMRSTQHIFEAVVFYHVRATHLEVVAQIASPQFKLKSFRRSITQSGKKPKTTKPRQPAKEETEAKPRRRGTKNKAKTRTASPTTRTSRAAAVTITRITFTSFDDPEETTIHSTARCVPQSSSGPAPSDVLGLILRWLSELPASSVGSRLMLKWQSMVLDACKVRASARRQDASDHKRLVPILSALDLSTTSQSHLPASTELSHQRVASPLDTIDAAVRMLLHEWLEVDDSQRAFEWLEVDDSQRAFEWLEVDDSQRAFERFVGRDFHPSGDELAETHTQWLSEVAERAQRYVHTHTRTSWSQLVAMTSRYEDTQLLSSTTGDGTDFSFRSFVAQYRQCYMSQHRLRQRDSIACGNKGRRMGHFQSIYQTDASSRRLDSCPAWICRMEDVAIEMNGQRHHVTSLLTVVQFWKLLSCLRLDFSPASSPTGAPARLSVASVFNTLVSDGSFTKLTLDGQYRWFNCLPSGEPTVGTTLMGYVVGDYVGRATSADTIHITTYLWPAIAETATAFAWHWTIDAASLSTGSAPSVVSVVVETASVGWTSHAMETMSMAEKLPCVGRWQHACELRLVYNSHEES